MWLVIVALLSEPAVGKSKVAQKISQKLAKTKFAEKFDSLKSAGFQFREGKAGLGSDYVIEAYHPEYGVVGKAAFKANSTGTKLIPVHTVVKEEHRRKGIGSALYSTAEEVYKTPIANKASHQTEDAKAFWSQRGRPFGGAAVKIVDKLVSKSESMSKATATKLLESIDSPEAALKLSGKERQQYLDALDVVYGDRTKRGSKMGFDMDTTYYHGSPNSNIQEFDPSFAGKNANSNMAGVFFTTDKNYAKKYTSRDAGFGSNLTKEETLQNYIDNLPEKDAEKFLQELGKIEAPFINQAKAQDVKDVRRVLNLDDAPTSRLREDYQNAVKKFLEDKKVNLSPKGKVYDVNLKLGKQYPKTLPADVQDFTDDVTGYNSVNLDSANGPETAVFEPEQIRSTNAAFDPRFKDSPYIMSATERSASASPFSAAKDIASKLYNKLYKGSAAEKVDDARSEAIKKFSQQTDLYKAATGRDDERFQDIAETAADFIVPGTIDGVPMLGSVVSKVAKGAKAASKGAVVGDLVTKLRASKMPNVAAEQAQKAFDSGAVKVADSMDLKKNSNVIGPVFNSGPQNYGSVTVKEAPKAPLGKVLVRD